MYVRKQDGTLVPFSKQRIIITCRRIGVAKKEAERIAALVRSQIREGDTTKKIYTLTLRELRKISTSKHTQYRLRESIAKIEPHIFEKYVQRVLAKHGYICDWNIIIQGRAVDHQVDIVAKKGKSLFLIECKHHHSAHRETGLGKVLQVQARLEDVLDGFNKGRNKYGFKQAWMVTNTRYSEHARRYATAKKIILTGWDNGTYSLRKLADFPELNPLTALLTANNEKEITRLMENDIITFNDFLMQKETVLKLINPNLYNEFLRKVENILKVR